jgi:hypothetical protein
MWVERYFRYVYFVAINLSVLFAIPAGAHHSFVAHYVADETVAVSGIVEEFWFENPHARLLVDVESESGDTERWVIETASKNNLIRNGWDGSEIQPGQHIETTGNPSRDGSTTMQLRALILPDGTIYKSVGGGLRAEGK